MVETGEEQIRGNIGVGIRLLGELASAPMGQDGFLLCRMEKQCNLCDILQSSTCSQYLERVYYFAASVQLLCRPTTELE